MSNATVSTLTPFVSALFASVDADIHATTCKGDAVKAAHTALDGADSSSIATIDADIAAIRPNGNKDKRIEKAYKLGKRFTAIALFLKKHGLDFALVGTQLTEKKTISLNMVEAIRSNLTNNEGVYHSASLVWTNEKDFHAFMVNCEAIDKQGDKAANEARNKAFISQKALLDEALAKIAAFEANAKATATTATATTTKGKGKAKAA